MVVTDQQHEDERERLEVPPAHVVERRDLGVQLDLFDQGGPEDKDRRGDKDFIEEAP